MSYINFTYESRQPRMPVGAAPHVDHLEVGYCREGGRVDRLVQDVTDDVTLAAHRTSVVPDEAVRTAAEGLKGALAGAGWVAALTVERTATGAPAEVSWTTRSDGTGSAAATALPSDIAQVMRAAERLESVLDVARHVPFTGD